MSGRSTLPAGRLPLTPAGHQGYLFSTPPEAPATVSLFSGGLDSLAGLAKHSMGTMQPRPTSWSPDTPTTAWLASNAGRWR